jgi:2-polyprenyl-6-methoxyphenol hydroxylase-like FAD-dependent oxidoreductase
MAQRSDQQLPVLIAGGGIGGLATALTLHQIGVPCLVLESVGELKPLGVGINLQPNAVRELYDLDIGAEQLDSIGLQALEWALVGLNGSDVYSEPRGLEAGYRWPQYSVHRGRLQMLLYEVAVERLGADAIQTGRRVTGYRNRGERNGDGDGGGVTVTVAVQDDEGGDGDEIEIDGSLLIAADGIHSTVRAQMHPDQGPVNWNGTIMWRGTTPGVPARTGASFIGLGTHRHRIVFYPISQPDPDTGLAEINWIAEVTFDDTEAMGNGDWTKQVEVEDFIGHFEDWDYDWIDVQGMLRGGNGDDPRPVWEYPMIDRDPVPHWVDGNVLLIGDAAHAMFPTGSNGASQAIVDARILGAKMLEHGVTAEALAAFNDQLCEEISAVVLRNRGAGPFGLLNMLDERCGGVFDNIDDVIAPDERAEFMRRYQEAAGFAKDQLNVAPPTIAPGARVR